jgi:hypothetical protein
MLLQFVLKIVERMSKHWYMEVFYIKMIVVFVEQLFIVVS